jgi:hypothetical protein
VVDGAVGDAANLAWWSKANKPDDVTAMQTSLSVVNLGQPGSAPPSVPQSPSMRRGVNLLDEVVSFTILVSAHLH